MLSRRAFLYGTTALVAATVIPQQKPVVLGWDLGTREQVVQWIFTYTPSGEYNSVFYQIWEHGKTDPAWRLVNAP